MAPPRDFLQKVSSFKGLEKQEKTRDVHNGSTTRRAALVSPAGRSRLLYIEERFARPPPPPSGGPTVVKVLSTFVRDCVE